jgi:hypothetical protein
MMLQQSLSFVLQTIMADPWLNVGYEEEKMIPYQEPEHVFQTALIGKSPVWLMLVMCIVVSF